MRFLPALRAFGILLAGGLAGVNATASPRPILYSIDPAIDPAARCNDHTLPAYWYRPGTGDGRQHWVIWLEGGGMCLDQPSCAGRASHLPSLLTSNGFTARSGRGVLSPDPAENPILFNANAVLIHYCSSDAWSGGKPASGVFDPANPNTWNFAGRHIAKAAFQSVFKRFPAITSARQVLIGGTSAGGEGITTIANDVIPLLPRTVSILLANDAGFALDIGQFDPTTPSPYTFPGHPNAFETQFLTRLAFWGARGDAVCDANAHTVDAHAACLDSGNVLRRGYIKIPSFVAESQLDIAQIALELCAGGYGPCSMPNAPNSPQGVYATAFASKMAAALAAGALPGTVTVFSPQHFVHGLLGCGPVLVTKFPFPNGELPAQAIFDQWLSNPRGRRVVEESTAPGVVALPIFCRLK